MTTRRELANAMRALAMDAVEKANSGHPGMPMGMADIAEVLWNDFLQFNPGNPKWDNRDRFVLSNGHGSMLQYALLHLTGYDLPMEQLKQFRQLHSKTAGSSGSQRDAGRGDHHRPAGSGHCQCGRLRAGRKGAGGAFQPARTTPWSITTPGCSCGDGCLMEGISHEAASLAGTWKLGKLVADLRRQRHLDRRRSAGLVHRRHRRRASRPTAGT